MAPQSLGFVEVPPAPAATQLELSRPDGTRLCIHTPASTLPLDAVVRAFVEGRSGSNDPPKPDFWATEAVDFRQGLDGLVAVCRQVLGDNPLEGAVYVLRNRA